MSISIAVISARQSLDNIMKVDDTMSKHCNIEYFAYSTPQELTRIYIENASKFDGILFSGSYPHDYLIENVCAITKPHKCLDLNDRDYYWIIAKLFAENPNIDFSRVHFDNPTDASPFENVFSKENMPMFSFASSLTPPYPDHLKVFYQAAMQYYEQLWLEKKVDLFVVRLTNLAQSLEKANLPHYLLRPSPATVLDCFFSLLTDIQSAILQNTLVACCVIKVAKEQVLPEDLAILEKELLKFNQEQNMALVVRKDGNCFEVTTSSFVLKDLTSDYTTCLLTSVLYERLPFSTWIGWGISFHVVTSHQNALMAIAKSQKDAQKYTYLVNEKDEMVGPLLGDRSISYSIKPSSHCSCVGKALGISPLNLEKILSLKQKKNVVKFSADDLAFYLDITQRSATRILKKLFEHGGATEITSRHLSGRGRPSRIFEINLDRVVF